jgi:L-fuconolactonase
MTAVMTIDSHQHFWKYNAQEYGWIADDVSMAALRRDFLPADLQPALAAAGIDGAISVQARQSLEETEWLLDMAERHDFLVGVVGWAPLTDPDIARTVEKLAARGKLVGLRHIVQGEPDDRFLLRDDFNRGIDALEAFDLAYDILIYERQLPAAIEFVDRHPRQRFVLDHIAKPRIRDGAISPWRENLRELARHENVWCKLSGVATEADFKHWTEAQLRPYIDAAIEAFGSRRMMFGSDWPVCLAAISYADWAAMVKRALGSFGAAAAAYRVRA